MTTIPLRFQVGARTLAAVDRDLARVALSLDDVIAQRLPTLPAPEGDGFLVTSLPEGLVDRLPTDGLLVRTRQRYTRWWTDLMLGHEAWRSGLSGNARSTIARKTKRLANQSGGTIDIRAYRTAEEIAAFHPLARAVSATTYQERLLGSGLPADASALLALAANDAVRGWLLFLEAAPIAYLCCTADRDTLLYTHVGHDPAHNALSPGTVLQAEAMKALFADRFTRFDFTEGEGQHKRLFATRGEACVDLLLLRPTFANRATLAALAGFDAAVALAKRAATQPLLARIARKVRR